jgi:hypothetical protein
MIELTTGVIFLISSLYGSGHIADDHIQNISAMIPTTIEATTDIRTLTNNPAAMEAYLRKEFADAPILVDIARCESNFKQFDADGNVIRGRVDENDIGLMQINEHYQGETAKRLGFDIYTVEGNIGYARHLYERQGSQPWSASSKCWGAELASNK